MRTSAIISVLLLFVLIIGACTVSLVAPRDGASVDYQKQFESHYSSLRINEPSMRQEEKPLVLAHYMPWFQKYGYHWSEGSVKYDPSQILPNGRANIASHYYPLTGNYDSADPVVLEYQLALMKMAGIDGVIFDWYGITEGIDYKPIHEATLAMIELIKKRGMKYVICYEDQSIKHLMEFGVIPRNTGISVAKETFEWMDKNWFNDGAYVKVDGRPLVLCFGPQHFYQRAEWDQVWSGLSARPFFIDLDARTSWADGTMNWSPMHMSSGGRLSIGSLVRYLNEFYQRQQHKPFIVGTVFPSFHDIYLQAGKMASYGYLHYSDGETLKLTYAAAERARANVIQIQTWNDYGEGTIIEPTIERGYKDLEFFQDKRLEWESDFPFNYSDLRIPIELFKIMENERSTDAQKRQVANIYNLLFTGNANGFRQAVRAANISFDFSVSPLLFTPTTGTQTAVIFDPAGRRNLALGKPIVASSRIDVYTANRANDGDVSSYWEGGARAWPGTLQVDLGSPEKIKTIVIKLNPHRMWAKRTQRIEVKAGNDVNNLFTVVAERDYIFDPVENSNIVVISMDTTARFVQLVFTANSGATNGQVAEFEIYGE